jgi:hypothetical protein
VQHPLINVLSLPEEINNLPPLRFAPKEESVIDLFERAVDRGNEARSRLLPPW